MWSVPPVGVECWPTEKFVPIVEENEGVVGMCGGQESYAHLVHGEPPTSGGWLRRVVKCFRPGNGDMTVLKNGHL